MKVGPTTVTLPLGANITDQQVGQALTRYARGLGIPIAGDAQTDLTAILSSIVYDIKHRARVVDVADQQAAAQASINAAADAGNNL